MTEPTFESATEINADLLVESSLFVLYVDDEPNSTNIIKNLLGFVDQIQVETASSADEAMRKMKEKTYDIVVSDYVMPGKDGLGFLQELREKGINVPFILVTEDLEEVKIKALRSGAIDCIYKRSIQDSDISELVDRILETVNSWRAEVVLVRTDERGGSPLGVMYDYLVRLIRDRPIRWNNGLIYASSFSYLAAAIATFIGYPSQDPRFVPISLQIAFYIVMSILLVASQLNRPLRWALAGVYGAVAMLSFSGVQRWINYHGDSSFLGPAMAAWDIALAIALMDNE